MFLKNKNIIFKIRRSKVTDYAALTLLQEFEWQYLTACPYVFLSTTNHFAQHVQKKAFQCQNVPMVEFEAIFRIFGGAAKI